MNKNKLLSISLALASLLLTSCGEDNNDNNDNNNGNTDWSADTTPISFEDAYYQVVKFNDTEAKNASNVTVETTSQSGPLVDKTIENFVQYSDGTTSSSGTYTRYLDEAETFSTTFKAIKTKVIDKYQLDDGVYSYEMFTEVKDYDNDETPTSSYKDSISKKFIVNSASEAEEAGLTKNQYVVASELSKESSAKSSITLANFLAYCVVSNTYLSQLGVSTISISYNDITEEFTYSLNANYSYEGDLNNTVNEYVNVKYITSKNKKNLKSFDCEYKTIDQNKSDEDDYYVSSTSYKGELTYNTKSSTKDSNVLDPNDYFLRSISEIGLLAQNSSFDKINVDATAIPLNCSYIFGFAKTYAPKKAVNIDINPISSSNEEVVKFSDDQFEIIAKGEATLTFGYYKKINDVYTYTYAYVNVTITDANVEKITFNPKPNWYYSSSFVAGNTYNWDISVLPNNASKAISATSSDESVLKVSVDENNNLVIEALKEGPATITVTSIATPEMSVSKSCYVLSDEIDYKEYLINNSFIYDASKTYNYTYTMTFKDDGTGTRVQYDIDDGQSYTDTFNWTLEGTLITFTKWIGNDVPHPFEYATICKILDYQTGEVTGMGFYAETSELGKEFIEQ